MNLLHYRPQFKVGEKGLRLGAGTEVRILDLRLEKDPDAQLRTVVREQNVRVVATVELVARGALATNINCEACKVLPPEPDSDGLWYIMENHDGTRLLFAHSEELTYRHPERDSYPAPGWRTIGESVYCPTCYAQVLEAIEDVKGRHGKPTG